jgi:hypothetical protein
MPTLGELAEQRHCLSPSPPGFAGGGGQGEGGQCPSRNREISVGSLSPLTPDPGSPAKPGGEGRKRPVTLYANAIPALLLLTASMTIGSLDAWSVGEHDYRFALAARDQPDQARPLLVEAAQYFDAAVADGSEPRSYLVYGNTLYLVGRRADAVAVYRRGLSHRPDDAFLRSQLAIAETELAGAGNPMPISFPSPWLSGTLVSTLSAILVLVAALSWAIGRRTRRPRLGRAGVWSATAILIALLVAFLLQTGGRQESANTWTVRQESPLRVGNSVSFDPIPQALPLRAGQAVHVLGTRGGWSHVECPGGKTGWLKIDVLIR